jgi:hypothetical protein
MPPGPGQQPRIPQELSLRELQRFRFSLTCARCASTKVESKLEAREKVVNNIIFTWFRSEQSLALAAGRSNDAKPAINSNLAQSESSSTIKPQEYAAKKKTGQSTFGRRAKFVIGNRLVR